MLMMVINGYIIFFQEILGLPSAVTGRPERMVPHATTLKIHELKLRGQNMP